MTLTSYSRSRSRSSSGSRTRGAIELDPFQWTIDAPREPTTLVFDLDPGEPADLADSAGVAVWLRDVLAELGLVSYVKTSGSLGLHVHVPLGTPHEGEHLKAFARAIGEALAQQHPAEVVAEMDKRRRAGKVFVDWLQNDPTRQTAAPYSLRGVPWPTVAAPLTWDEVERAARERRPELLTVIGYDVFERLDRHGDHFAEALELEQELPV
jgi:bifunctional non-homologous end joining protein LigD